LLLLLLLAAREYFLGRSKNSKDDMRMERNFWRLLAEYPPTYAV